MLPLWGQVIQAKDQAITKWPASGLEPQMQQSLQWETLGIKPQMSTWANSKMNFHMEQVGKNGWRPAQPNRWQTHHPFFRIWDPCSISNGTTRSMFCSPDPCPLSMDSCPGHQIHVPFQWIHVLFFHFTRSMFYSQHNHK